MFSRILHERFRKCVKKNPTKTGKSRDPEVLVREIFKNDIIGEDLKVSLLTMLNSIKQEGILPDFMKRQIFQLFQRKTNQDYS